MHFLWANHLDVFVGLVSVGVKFHLFLLNIALEQKKIMFELYTVSDIITRLPT